MFSGTDGYPDDAPVRLLDRGLVPSTMAVQP